MADYGDADTDMVKKMKQARPEILIFSRKIGARRGMKVHVLLHFFLFVANDCRR